jgi:aspartate aminotransferase
MSSLDAVVVQSIHRGEEQMQLSTRVCGVKPSLTLAITAKANAMRAEGIPVYSFSAGEPDFDTPAHIKAAATKALTDGKTKYGAVAGEMALREAISRKLAVDNGLDYTPDRILVTNGGKHSLFNLMLALLNPGDEVLVPAPYWLSYPEMIRLADATPVTIETSASNNFKLTPELLTAAITQRTKLLILNSPSNPSGVVYTRSELEAIAKIVVDRDLLVVSDEIYEKIIYGGCEHVSIGSLNSEIASRTIISNGFAKAYAMTGWRIGYLAAPLQLIKAANTIQGHSTSNVCTFAQYGAVAALDNSESQISIEKMRSAFADRRTFILERLQSIPSISYVRPDGAFYAYIDISASKLKSINFCQELLEKQQVAVIPGLPFGHDDYIRLSYATSMETLEKGLNRLDKFMQNKLNL